MDTNQFPYDHYKVFFYGVDRGGCVPYDEEEGEREFISEVLTFESPDQMRYFNANPWGYGKKAGLIENCKDWVGYKVVPPQSHLIIRPNGWWIII